MAEYTPFQVLTADELNASFDGLAAAVAAASASVAAVATSVGTETGARIAADLALISAAMRPFSIAGTVLAATNLLQIQNPAAGGVLRSLAGKAREIVSVTDFGADPTFTTDSTLAFNKALLAAKSVFIPDGKYLLAGLVTMPQDGGVLHGSGPNAVELTSNQTTGNMITCAVGLSIATIGGFTMSRSVTPTAGAGLAPVTINKMNIRDVRATGQFIGFALGAVAAGTVRDCIAEFNKSHGFSLRNDATHSVLQWTLDTCLSQNNDGWGFAVTGTVSSGGAMIPLSPWVNCTTFANTGGGVILQGSASAQLWDFAAKGCWFGSDNYDEIYFDTYGGNHFVQNSDMELAGQSVTGSLSATPASHTGNGVEITANNRDVHLIGGSMQSISFDGVLCSDSLFTVVSGCIITQVGLAVGSNYGGVVNVGAGNLLVSGCRIGSQNPGDTSQFGISVADGSKLTAVGNDLRFNSLGAIAMSTNYAAANISANRGYLSRFGGQVSIPAGATSVVVTHNLGLTAGQTPIRINVTPLGDYGAIRYWVDTLTMTTFTLRVSASNVAATFYSYDATATSAN